MIGGAQLGAFAEVVGKLFATLLGHPKCDVEGMVASARPMIAGLLERVFENRVGGKQHLIWQKVLLLSVAKAKAAAASQSCARVFGELQGPADLLFESAHTNVHGPCDNCRSYWP